MSTAPFAQRPMPAAITWHVELDTELSSSAGPAAPARVARLAALMQQTHVVHDVTAIARCQRRFVRVHLMVEAPQLADAVELASTVLRNCGVDAGLGQLILVGARGTAQR
jgi:hypothetical protein